MSSRKPPSINSGGQPLESCQRAVIVIPKSSRNLIAVHTDGTLAIRVTAPPADGAANKAVLAVLSDALSLSRSRIEIVRGSSSRQKLVRFELSAEELDRRLKLVGQGRDGATS